MKSPKPHPELGNQNINSFLQKKSNIPNCQCHRRSKSNKRSRTSHDPNTKVVTLGDGWQVSGRSTDSLFSHSVILVRSFWMKNTVIVLHLCLFQTKILCQYSTYHVKLSDNRSALPTEFTHQSTHPLSTNRSSAELEQNTKDLKWAITNEGTGRS